MRSLLSTQTIVLFRSCFLWTAGYYLIVNPAVIAEHTITLILGASMQMSLLQAKDLGTANGLIGVLFIVLGLSDVAVLSADDYVMQLAASVPVRLMGFFILTAVAYLQLVPIISNSLTFTYCFLEVLTNFILFTTVREERNEIRKQKIHEIRKEGLAEDEQ